MVKKFSLTTIYVTFLSFILTNTTFGATNPGPKIEEGLQQVQTFLTGIIVAVGICAGVWIVIKKLPGIDDPMVKNEMFRGVGMVLAGVAVGAALVWLVPWVFNLFQ
ncbi:TPA: CagC family type IV secretion system protein [Staphylococcus aureus]|uniref:CagC family type IV secretion system protein n=1 Tax=Staphylococcus TaxID=1279 RepID=UPI0029012F34|nr:MULTISPECIES: CagC family type IV secretion system protein [Staphylococcus]MDU0435907.1 CagC family type IV secretion system protein [Staphylococcus haemolyticus]MDU0463544.1 CagC family type IV secretion system protein [Staphylococcus ureilyticus]